MKNIPPFYWNLPFRSNIGEVGGVGWGMQVINPDSALNEFVQRERLWAENKMPRIQLSLLAYFPKELACFHRDIWFIIIPDTSIQN